MFLCIGIPAFLFAIAHYGTQSTLSLFINILPISLVLGYVYAKYRSILINTTIHATVNVLAIAVLFWSLPSYVPNASHFSIIPDSIKSETLKDSVTVADRVAYLTIVTSTG